MGEAPRRVNVRGRDRPLCRGADVPKGTCADEACEQVGRLTRGLCDMHYKRLIRAGLPPRPLLRDQRCRVEGCDRGQRARGFCSIHYRSIYWPSQHQTQRTCEQCGALFAPSPSNRSNPRLGRFCTLRCKGLWCSGDRHPHWRGGLTPEHARIRASVEYRTWRLAVFERDDFTCQGCGTRGGMLNADHVQPFAYFPELRFDVSNGRTLCVPCHRETPTYGARGRRMAP